MELDIDRIKACKLYRVSPRKSAILSSLQAQKLVPLKVQDRDEVDLPDTDKTNIDPVPSELNRSFGTESNISEEGLEPHKVDDEGNPVSYSETEGQLEPELRQPEAPEDGKFGDIPPKPPIENPMEPTPQQVESATGTTLPRVDVTDSMHLEVQDIKGILNALDSTCGVSRVHSKDNGEVWIYYNDTVNLNDVMVPVIEELNRPGYTYLNFNRLARSENSLVFVITKNDTERVKKPEVVSDTSDPEEVNS